jgi:hypothetical protein
MHTSTTPFTIGASILVPVAALILLSVLFGQRIAGQFMAWQENQRFRAAGANPKHVNPPARQDTFSGALSPAWAFSVINGANQIGHAPSFHNSIVSVDDGLVIASQPDPNFNPQKPYYNNATLIGFQGYQPTPQEDVIFQTRMQVSPHFSGSAGFMVQPQGTILEDGSFVGPFKNGAFTLFGVCFLGPESNLLGANGVTVQRVINWWPEKVEALPVDMHQLHTYELRLNWVDEKTWQGITSVDGQVVSTMELPPLGPLELHVWSDNYLLGTSWNGTPQISFQNGEAKWIRFQGLRVLVEIARP